MQLSDWTENMENWQNYFAKPKAEVTAYANFSKKANELDLSKHFDDLSVWHTNQALALYLENGEYWFKQEVIKVAHFAIASTLFGIQAMVYEFGDLKNWDNLAWHISLPVICLPNRQITLNTKSIIFRLRHCKKSEPESPYYKFIWFLLALIAEWMKENKTGNVSYYNLKIPIPKFVQPYYDIIENWKTEDKAVLDKIGETLIQNRSELSARYGDIFPAFSSKLWEIFPYEIAMINKMRKSLGLEEASLEQYPILSTFDRSFDFDASDLEISYVYMVSRRFKDEHSNITNRIFDMDL